MRLLKAIGQRFNRNRNGVDGRKQKHENPSISDYADKKSLMHAMLGRRGVVIKDAASVASHSLPASSYTDDEPSFSAFDDDSEASPIEWTLPLVDEQVTEPQTMEEEVKRLEVLQSYFVLDSDGEEDFDRVTRMGSKVFDVPICLVSLVDLGRQWFLSRVGLDATETPRKHAFCAHVILNKYKMLVVPDASKDFRFKHNPLVTDGLKIRFYAGAALVSPEGYKLGTVCIISPVARPQGLDGKEQEMLHEMANMVIGVMVARRNRHLMEEYENRFRQLAKTVLDTNESLQNAKHSLEALIMRNSWGMEKEVSSALSNTIESLDVQSKMCKATVRSILQDTPDAGTNKASSSYGQEDSSFGGSVVAYDDIVNAYDNIVNPTADVQKLFDGVNKIVANFPLQGAVTVEIDKSVPRFIDVDDLLLFRATLNLLTHCMGASPSGCASGLRIRKRKTSENELLIQCVQGGGPVAKGTAKELFAHKDSLLAPVASIVRSMGGKYGMYEARWNPQNSRDPVQSVFWIQVPFEVNGASEKRSARRATLSSNLVMTHEPKKQAVTVRDGEKPNTDPFYAALMEAGCGTRLVGQ